MKLLFPGLLLALASIVSACGSSTKADLPNVVLITIDTLRSDHCSCYGYPRETTPRLDALAKEGARFEVVYSPIPTTGPCHASLFSSLYPLVHGVTKNGFVLDDSVTTLAEVLKRRGYSTAALVSSYPLNKKFGCAQGFEFYDDDFSEADPSVKQKKWEGMDLKGEKFDRRADDTTNRAIAWLKAHSGEGPFFLWVHYFDPHQPFDPPEPYASLFPADPALNKESGFDTRPYDAEIRFADHEMGKLLDVLESCSPGKKTLITVTSDHGEGLTQHDHMGHGLYIYEEAVRVPLVFRWTGRIPPGQTLKTPAEITDLMPTILSLLDLPFDRGRLQGRDLGPYLLQNAPSPPDRCIFLQRRFYESKKHGKVNVVGNKFGIREGKWKLILAKEEESVELYDLEADPGERTNQADGQVVQRQKLIERLLSMQTALEKMALSKKQHISEEDNERFKTLGYIK
jgi:arylsulfatase A-like enzyme